MASSWSERGSAAVDAGDLDTAKQHFSRAVKAEGGTAGHRLHLAIVLEALGELDAAAQQLAHALRLDPQRQDAARRLAALLRRTADGAFDHVEFNATGLRHGLSHDRVDRQAIANVAIRYLVARSPLREALATGRSRGWLEAARGLCLERSSPLLKDELLLKILRSSVLSNPELEMLLTAMRRILLLELPAKRFADSALVGFAVALLEQCWSNQFVWLASEEEAHRLAEESIRPDMLASGDGERRSASCGTACISRSRRHWAGGSIRQRCRHQARRRARVDYAAACKRAGRARSRCSRADARRDRR